MTPLQIAGTLFALGSGLVGAVVGIESRYEKAADADSTYERLAADQETDRLSAQLEIVKIKIQRFVEIAGARPLSEAEQIELRSLESERDAILARLASKG
jgi:hypothetical protein